ncbi:hypothetical protein NSPZN2_11421 [Nitrospira defluvii]|uniref:Uncharacterized protein n=1 Tax=Nitrospira defluvii TaxID=330214 RepID=A0ABM8QU32_9BACT|nr:hypothetical protein NSPZN2_11421 [Nitrospira defluvii]
MIDRRHRGDSAGRFRRRDAGITGCHPTEDGRTAGLAFLRRAVVGRGHIAVLRFVVDSTRHRRRHDLTAREAEIRRADQAQRKQDGHLLHKSSLSRLVDGAHQVGALRGGSIGNLSRLVNRKAGSCHVPLRLTVLTLGPYDSIKQQLSSSIQNVIPKPAATICVRKVSDVVGPDPPEELSLFQSYAEPKYLYSPNR